MTHLNRGWFVAVLAVLAWSVTAFAQPTEAEVTEAQGHFYRGLALAEEARWAEALEEFERSSQLVPRASTQYNIANALYNLGRPVKTLTAIERYLELAAESPEPSERLEQAEQLATFARRRVVTLHVRVSPEEATLTLDGDEVPGGAERELLVDPGEHVLRATLPGHEPAVLRATYPAGSRAESELRPVVLSKQPPPTEAGTRAAPRAHALGTQRRNARGRWTVGLSIASASLLAAGAGTGMAALALSWRVESGCRDGDRRCDPRDRPTARRADRLAWAADGLLAVGVAAACGAGVQWLLDRRERRTAIVPVVALTKDGAGAGLRASFR